MSINRYKNPWWKSTNIPRPEFYENNAPLAHEYRGVKVFRLFEKAYDFVLGDCCITQRAGVTEYKNTIDEILDGNTPVSDKVANHLLTEGFEGK